MFSEKCYDRGVSSWNLKLLVWEKFFTSRSIDVDLGKKKAQMHSYCKKSSCILKASGCICTHAHMCTLKCVFKRIQRNDEED